MPTPMIRRFLLALVGTAIFVYLVSNYTHIPSLAFPSKSFSWADIPFKYDEPKRLQLPWLSSGSAPEIPRIQAAFEPETKKAEARRLARRAAILEAFQHTWKGYTEFAWLHDELKPLTAGHADPFGGWGATLIDSLDTLWLMDQIDDFNVAVLALRHINFKKCTLTELNTFETVIRFLGGLLSAWDLCCENDGKTDAHTLAARRDKYAIILETAIEVGEMMYHAFDTPNNIPIARWKWAAALEGGQQDQGHSMIMAELGTLSMEFTRLSQLTGDAKFFSATEHLTNILAEGQNTTRLPGLWPLAFDPTNEELDFTANNEFTMGGMVDSIYEYLPKMYLLLHGRQPLYERMYHRAAEAAKRYLIFEPRIPVAPKLSPLVLGRIDVFGPLPHQEDASNKRTFDLRAEGQHLTCFAGGMFALGARLFTASNTSKEDAEVGERITDGCVWTYLYTSTGLGPEVWKADPCRKGRDAVTDGEEVDYHGNHGDCQWLGSPDLGSNGLPAGMTAVTDTRYILRPEAIESVFIMHRTTGEAKWAEIAWQMWEAIQKYCRTQFGYAGASNMVGKVDLIDSAESFWTGETLKYFYLIFSDPELMSLDEFVLNTEAHPFRWRVIASKG